MKNITLTCMALCLASAAQAEVTFLQPTATDQYVLDIAEFDAKTQLPTFNDNREPVQMSWAVELEQPLTMPAPLSGQSREYWLDASAAELATGVDLPLNSRAALVRISAEGVAQAKGLDRAALTLSQGGRVLGDEAIQTFADQAQMKRSGAGFPEGTIAFRLAPIVEKGVLTVRINGATAKTSRYVLHVYEPESGVVLDANMGATRHLLGQPVQVRLGISGLALGAKDAAGYIVSPQGQRVANLAITATPDGFLDAKATPTDLAAGPGLWEAHVFVNQRVGDRWVMRDIKLPFAVTATTARLTGDAKHAHGAGIGIDLEVEAAAAGRYEVSGVLFGTLADGTMIPVAAAASANWLDAGMGTLNLRFEDAHLATDAAAPFEVRHLALKDQSRMGVLWLQERGLRVSDRFK